MTLTGPSKPGLRRRSTSRFRWAPAAAAWAVGAAATLSLLASMSPVIRWTIRVPREFIDKYLFNFPDTSLAWAFVLGLLAAALVMLVLARGEFGAKVRRGALLKSAATLAAGWTVAILLCWGLIEVFPGTVERPWRLPYVVNRVVGFALLEPDFFPGKPDFGLKALCGLLGALALIIAAIVLFLSQRAENALTGQDESAIRGLLEQYGQNDSLGYFATRRDKSVCSPPTGAPAANSTPQPNASTARAATPPTT